MSTKTDKINSYLWCGYLPPDEFPEWLTDCISPDNAGKTYSPQEAAKRFDSMFNDLIERTSSGRHIIPLSGGWDSRAILGALLERVDIDRILAVTFGVPGQLDYDLGKWVADSAGVEHHAIDLRSINFTWESIRKSVINSPWTYVPDGMFNSLCWNVAVKNTDTFWSGFLGGTLVRDRITDFKSNHQSQIYTFSSQQRRVKSDQLFAPYFSLTNSLPLPSKNLDVDYEFALNMGIRQVNCIAPIVLPIKKWERWGAIIGNEKTDAKVIAPFANANWAGYWLSAPREVRKGKKLYLEMLERKYPELFSLPEKSDRRFHLDNRMIYLGRRIIDYFFMRPLQQNVPRLGVRSSLMLNYLDYDEMFRTREDYSTTLTIAFNYLNDHNIVPWLDLDQLWDEHLQRRKDHGDAFLVLIGLAANLIENPLDNEKQENS